MLFPKSRMSFPRPNARRFIARVCQPNRSILRRLPI
jgi:hypothetical protein